MVIIFKDYKITSIGEDVDKLESYAFLVGM